MVGGPVVGEIEDVCHSPPYNGITGVSSAESVGFYYTPFRAAWNKAEQTFRIFAVLG